MSANHNAQPEPSIAVIPDMVRACIDGGYKNRLFDPLTNDQATVSLLETRRTWRHEGATTIFSTGVFDVFHQNHRAYLLANTICAMHFHYEKLRGNFEQEASSTSVLQEFAKEVLPPGGIRQIVSVDGDSAVNTRKSNDPAKGDMSRPIYSWPTRARDTLNASVRLYGSQPHFLVDAVTMHDETVPELCNTPHHDMIKVARFLQPDIWAVYGKVAYIAAAAMHDRNTGGPLKDTALAYMPTEPLYDDALLGGAFSTTALTARIRLLGDG